jgi:superfamily I DNA/RNA helicase
MIGTEYKRRQHLSKEINSIVSVMSAISNLDDIDILWINDNLSYFKRNLLDMTFHKIGNDNPIYQVSEFGFEFYNLAEKYEFSKKLKMPADKFDKFLLFLKEQMETSFKYQYYLNDMEKRRVQNDAFGKKE